MAEALYRKYRPRIFEDVVGQEPIERTIKNAIAQDKVSHAYLFTGPRGTGKTTTARLLAKALLCENGPTAKPDGTCDDCEMIAAGTHPDVYELDAASRTGVENVREEIIGRVQFAPTRGDYKVYIIDEVHMLSTAAFNALLKTLEEPPGHVVFILCTTDPQKVPDTIHSRCQRFDFRPISSEAIVSRLGAICMEEGVEFEGDALELIAQRAEGGMRNALTSLEQLIAFGAGHVTLENAERMLGAIDTSDLAELVRALGTRDVAKAFRWTADYVETGADLAQFTRDLAEHVRTMYVLTLSGGESDVAVDVSETVRRELAEELPLFGPDRLARMMGVLGDLSAELRVSTNPRLSFEIALTRMVRPDSDLTLEALAERIERLEQGTPVQVRQSGTESDSSAASSAPLETEQPRAAASSAESAPEPQSESRSASVPAAAAKPEEKPDEKSAGKSAPNPETDASESASRTVKDEPKEAPVQEKTVQAAPAGDIVIPERIQQDLGNPASLQRLWQAVLSTLKQEKAAYGVLLLNTKAVYDEQKHHLTIEFPAESDFAFTAASKPEATEELKRCIEKVCGAAIPFTLTKGAKSGAASGGEPSTQARSAEPAEQREPAQQREAASRPKLTIQEEKPVAQRSAPAAEQRMKAKPQQPTAQDPYYDEVPLDAYGDVSYAVTSGEEASAPAAQKTTEPVCSAARSQAKTTVEAPAEAAPAADADEPSTTDLDAALAGAFGEGMVFTEVDE